MKNLDDTLRLIHSLEYNKMKKKPNQGFSFYPIIQIKEQIKKRELG